MRRYIYPLILVVLTVLIAVLNYTPGTYLTGWDTLHPELDFGLNFGRLVQGVWRGEQGLGALAGHSHMADLPRVAILWLLHFALPLNFLRYSYVFLCLIAGPIGVYYLIRFLLGKKPTEALAYFRDANTTRPNLATKRGVGVGADPRNENVTMPMEDISLCTALFYLFNLGTVQQFFAPFEMFTTQWAVLPWIILFSLKYLEQKEGAKTLGVFALITLLAAPMAYAAQLWYAFFVLYVLFLFGIFLTNRKSLKKSLILIAITLSINSFWLLPNLYFVATGSSVPHASKQNRIFSQEYRLRNRQNGYLADVALLKGFYLDWPLYNAGKTDFETLMPVWKQHMEKPWVKVVGYGLFAVAAAGVLLALYRRSRTYLPFLPFVVVPAMLLLNRTAPFDRFFDYLLTFGMLEEALRFVFSKLSIVLLFGYAIFFSYALSSFFSLVSAKLKPIVVVVLASLLIAYMSPMLSGQLISPAFRIAIPAQYFEFWNDMKTRPTGRVLTLPLHSFSGWVYHDWGYQGSGFLWFGLKQPLLDRDFDRWNSTNEESYREFYYAFYSGTPGDVARTLQKYNVRYIVWDTSVTAPTLKNTAQILYTRQNEKILAGYKNIATFGSIHVYEVSKKNGMKAAVHNVQPPYKWGFVDEAYKLFGTYISSDSKPALTMPFRNIQANTDRLNTDLFKIDTTNDLYRVESSLKSNGVVTVAKPEDSLKSIAAGVQLAQTTVAGTYKLEFIPLVPQGLLQSAEYSFVQKDKSVVSATINGKTFSTPITKLASQNRPIYLGEVSLYLRELNTINGLPVKIKFNRTIGAEATQDLYLRFGTQPITFSATDLAKRVRNAQHMTVHQGLSDPRLYFEVSGGTGQLSSVNQAGTYIGLEQLAHDTAYILVVRSRNLEGLPLRVCLADLFSHLCTLYDELSPSKEFTDDYFLIPPASLGVGYGLSLDNIAFGGMSSKNEVKQVVAIPIPSPFLSSLYTTPPDYKTINSSTLLSVDSAFHPDWRLFSPQNPLSLLSDSPKHVLVNNWANGWIVEPQNDTHYIPVFVPQVLEYIGFILLGGSFITLILSLIRKR